MAAPAKLPDRKPFKHIVADKLVETLQSAKSPSSAKDADEVLVVDTTTMAVLDACLGHRRVLEAGFLLVDKFESAETVKAGLRRRGYPEQNVVYFFQPKMHVLRRILSDYEQDVVEIVDEGKEDCLDKGGRLLMKVLPCLRKYLPDAPSLEKDPVQYKECRMLVMPDKYLEGMSVAKQTHLTLEKLKNDDPKKYSVFWERYKHDQQAKECDINFYAFDTNLFTTGMPNALKTLYPNSAEEYDDEDPHPLLKRVAYKVMKVCVALNEFPYIRFSYSKRGLTRQLAEQVHRELEFYQESHSSWEPIGHEDDAGAGAGDDVDISRSESWFFREEPELKPEAESSEPTKPATLLIVERADDIAAALTHTDTYQSMFYDLLDAEPCKPYVHKSSSGDSTPIKLDDSDPVFRTLRYRYIQDVVTIMNRGLKKRTELKSMRDSGVSSAMLGRVLSQLEVVSSFNMHYNIVSQLMTRSTSRDTTSLVVLEQVLVTGVQEHGDELSHSKVKASVNSVLQGEFNQEDQVRVFMLYLLTHCHSISKDDFLKLVRVACLSPNFRAALENLRALDIPLNKDSAKAMGLKKGELSQSAPEINVKDAKAFAQNPDNLRIYRYQSKLFRACRALTEGKLSKESFPYIRKSPDDEGATKEDETPYSPTALQDIIRVDMDAGAGLSHHGEARTRFTSEEPAKAVATATPIKSRRRRSLGTWGSGAPAESKGDPSGGAAREAKAEVDDDYNILPPEKKRTYSGSRVIVFVLGGISPSEITELENLSEVLGREIIYGGTSVSTARQFIHQLEMMKDPDSMARRGKKSKGKPARGGGGGGVGRRGVRASPADVRIDLG